MTSAVGALTTQGAQAFILALDAQFVLSSLSIARPHLSLATIPTELIVRADEVLD